MMFTASPSLRNTKCVIKGVIIKGYWTSSRINCGTAESSEAIPGHPTIASDEAIPQLILERGR